MTVKLKVLADAAQQMKFLLDKAESQLSTPEFKKALTAWVDLHSEVVVIQSRIPVEIEA